MPNKNGNGSQGGGMGKMGGNSLGAGGECVCTDCGHREPHQRGQPCTEKECPQCGKRMTRG